MMGSVIKTKLQRSFSTPSALSDNFNCDQASLQLTGVSLGTHGSGSGKVSVNGYNHKQLAASRSLEDNECLLRNNSKPLGITKFK